VNGKNYWLHNAGNSKATYNTVHPKRGCEGTDDNGVLKDFKGVAVHLSTSRKILKICYANP